MKFAEIRIALLVKGKILQNTIAHLEHIIAEQNENLNDAKENLSLVTDMIIALDSLSKDAE